MNTTPKLDKPLEGGSSPRTCYASLSPRHIEILDHTVKRAAGGRYCGGGETMDELVDIGLMKYIGTPAWCPDKFYAITDKGRAVLSEHNAKGEAQPPAKNL